ncbi:RNA recognition motif domain-containing protein [Chloroflexota bacterium]
MDIYVGSLPREFTEEDLRRAFEAYGQVTSAKVITHRSTGASKGFGFVEMPTEAEAQAAITGLNRKELKGQRFTVHKARPRSERGGGGRF